MFRRVCMYCESDVNVYMKVYESAASVWEWCNCMYQSAVIVFEKERQLGGKREECYLPGE